MDATTANIMLVLAALVQEDPAAQPMPPTGSFLESPVEPQHPDPIVAQSSLKRPRKASEKARAAIIPEVESDVSTPEVTPPKEPFRPKACQSCKDSHVSCGYVRPCKRCVRAGKGDECVDAIPKKRGRPTNESRLLEALEGIPPRIPKRRKTAPPKTASSKSSKKVVTDLERKLDQILTSVPVPEETLTPSASLNFDPISPESNDNANSKYHCLTPATPCSLEEIMSATAKQPEEDDLFNFCQDMPGIEYPSTQCTIDDVLDEANKMSPTKLSEPLLFPPVDPISVLNNDAFNGLGQMAMSETDQLFFDNYFNENPPTTEPTKPLVEQSESTVDNVDNLDFLLEEGVETLDELLTSLYE